MQHASRTAFCLLAGVAPAQSWTQVDDRPSTLAALVHEPGHGRLFAITSLPVAVWSFRGTGWRRQLPDDFAGVIAAGYDPVRGECVLLTDSQTLVSHGGRWVVRRYGAHAQGARVAFDPVSGRLLEFGGYDSFAMSYVDTTRSWDGSQWTTVTGGVRPSPRSHAAMATDPLRQRIVLFGGQDQGGVLGDTWEWTGAQWQQRATSGPVPRVADLAFDPASGRAVLLGGHGANYAPLGDCWAWDGTAWTARAALPQAGSARGFQDGSSLFVVTPQADVLRWTGQAWSQVLTLAGPGARWGAAALHDPARGEVLLYGGDASRQTWSWNGSWQLRASTGSAAHSAFAMAPLGGNVFLFGGAMLSPSSPGYVYLDETWRWNGQAWAQLQPSVHPPHRLGHAMVNAGNHILLFGGDSPTGLVADTWRFDGTTWTQLQPPNAPSARQGHAMVFDALRQRVVLFGGGAAQDDTWEWDGTTWTEVIPTVRPFGGPWQLVFDPVAGNVLLPQYSSAWRWDGVDWTADPQAAMPMNGFTAMAYDVGRQRPFAYDSAGRTLLFGPTPAGALGMVATCGSRPELSLLGRPAVGGTPQLHLEGAANAPALLAFSLQSSWVQLAPSCQLELGAVAGTLFGPLDARGELSVPLPVPPVLSLRGVHVVVQGAVLDSGPVGGLSLTGSLLLQVGD